MPCVRATMASGSMLSMIDAWRIMIVTGQGAQLAEEEPPEEGDEANRYPRLPSPEPEDEVDHGGAQEQHRQENRYEDEGDDLERDPSHPPHDPRPKRSVVAKKRR